MVIRWEQNSVVIGSRRLFDNPRAGRDCTVTYFTLAQTLAAQAAVVVDVGCGRGGAIDPEEWGRPLQDLRGDGRTVIGIDVDPAGEQNPIIDEFRLIGPDFAWPLEDESVDLVTCDWTLEHVTDPERFVAELTRVLRPGGAFVARTVSRYSVVSFGARLVPNRGHARVVGRLQPGREERDVFPTAYRANTRRELRALLDTDFEWNVMTQSAMDQYAGRWPRAARALAAVEPRLPRVLHHVLIVSARRRSRP